MTLQASRCESAVSSGGSPPTRSVSHACTPNPAGPLTHYGPVGVERRAIEAIALSVVAMTHLASNRLGGSHDPCADQGTDLSTSASSSSEVFAHRRWCLDRLVGQQGVGRGRGAMDIPPIGLPLWAHRARSRPMGCKP